MSGFLISFLGSLLAPNDQAVPQVVSTANPLPVTLSGGIGGLSVAGTVADGALALTQFPVTVGGIDTATGLLHRLSVDATGALKIVGGSGGGNVQGTIANGAAGNPNPVVGGGINAGNAISFAVDATGRQIVTGTAGAGAAAAGNPIVTGGLDGGGLVRNVLLDTSGRSLVVGSVAVGVAPTGNPVVFGGIDPGGLLRIPQTDTTGRFLIGGPVASGVAVTGNPVLAGARAATTNPAAVADGQAVFVRLDKSGRLVSVPFQPRELAVQSAVITLTTGAEILLIAAIAATFLDLVGIKIINTSATPVRLDVRDATAGTVVDTWEVPANSTVGQSFPSPFKQTTLNNNWTVQLAAGVTDVRVVAQFVLNT